MLNWLLQIIMSKIEFGELHVFVHIVPSDSPGVLESIQNIEQKISTSSDKLKKAVDDASKP